MKSVPEDMSKEKEMSEKKVNAALVKELTKMEQAEAARKAAFKARKEELAAAKAERLAAAGGA